MFWTLSEPDGCLTLELITRKTSDPVSQTCSDTRLAATSSDFPWVKTKVLNPSGKGILIFLLPPKFSASAWLPCDASPNHAPGSVKPGRVTSKWKQCGVHGTVREQRARAEPWERMSQELRMTPTQAGQCSHWPQQSPTVPKWDQAGDSDRFHW